MTLTVVRYRGSPTTPQAEVEVTTPYAAVMLLRTWQQRYPNDSAMVLDDERRTIATSQPAEHSPSR